MIQIKENGPIYEIRFRYDPEVIAIIKSVPSYCWHSEEKFWSIDRDKLGWLIRQFQHSKYASQIQILSSEKINVNEQIDPTIIPDVDISDVNFRVKQGSKPYSHQLDAMRFALNRYNHGLNSGFILADEQGLGKTIELCNIAIYNREHRHYNHCLIICCINSSKYNWQDDISEHTSGEYTPYILGSRLRRDKKRVNYNGSSADKLKDLESGHMYGDESMPELPYFLILNIEAIRYRVGKLFPIAQKLIQLVQSKYINMIALDEIHKNASPSSIQGKQILAIKSKTGKCCEWIPITGTPIVNKPTDVFVPLKLVDGHSYSNYYMWCKQFCIYGGFDDKDIVGYKNIPYLKSMLQSNMLRRLKSDTLDLPPKIECIRYVDNTPYQLRLSRSVANQINSDKSQIVTSMNPLAQFLKLRQVNGSPELVDDSLKVDSNYLKYNAKLQALLEVLNEISERNEKVVVFSNWVEPLRTLYKFVSQRYNVCCFTGTMAEDVRQQHKRVFQTNPKYTVMLGTIGALGTTHTLTAANNIVFYDEPWTPTDKQQAEDRVHRIGTTKSVNIYTLLSRGTIDDRVHSILYNKQLISKYIVDNKLDIQNNPELFDMIMDDYRV